jgi:hypothetical protein
VFRSRKIQIIILTVWAAVAIVAGSVLTSFHQPFALPTRSLVSLAGNQHEWRVLHLVAAGCGCSQKVSIYLAARAPLNNIIEEVLFIGAPDEFTDREALAAAGFRVRTIRAEELQALGVKGAPLLIFISPQGEVVYTGGYGAGSYQDASIWSRLQTGALVPPLPVLGCAVGRGLKRQLDPLSWKYTEERSKTAGAADENKR